MSTALQFHPVANIFPMMQPDEYQALVEDIRANGLLEPIWTHEGQVIDGRNRWKACQEAGIAPTFREWSGQGSLVAFVVALNLKRRHLNSGQRAVIALRADELARAEAKARQGARNDISQRFDESQSGRSDEQTAGLWSTNRQYISDARYIERHAPELLDEIVSDTVSISDAKRIAKEPSGQRERVLDLVGEGQKVNAALRKVSHEQKRVPPPLPSNKYRIVYADPPWAYGNSGVIGDSDNYGRAERHYPTMSIEELCALGEDIQRVLEDNAVLFLWVTSPLLEECFAVIRAWGFKYKTSFVWDKVAHNFGHYNSVRHEFLLICTRGSCLPDNGTLLDSVVSIEKSRKHSEKPEEFRELIDSLYLHGNRIELFSRKEAEGWDAWGNE